MPSRRQTLLGIANLAMGGFAVSSANSNYSTSPSADFRVLVVTDLQLKPGRPNERYVETDEEGLVELITLLDGADGVNAYTRTRFEQLVVIENNGQTSFDRLYFEFSVTDATDDPMPDIEEVLQIVSGTDEIDATGDTDFLTISESADVDDGTFDPGDSVPFGIQINLLPESAPGSVSTLPDPETFDITLTITAERDE